MKTYGSPRLRTLCEKSDCDASIQQMIFVQFQKNFYWRCFHSFFPCAFYRTGCIFAERSIARVVVFDQAYSSLALEEGGYHGILKGKRYD